MKKKALSILLTVAMAVTMLAGCGSSSSDNAAGSGAAAGDTAAQSEVAGNEAAASGDKTVINFYYSTDLEKTASKEIAAFNAANSDIEVVGHSVAEGDYDDKVKVMTAGGSTDADIYWVRTPAQMAQYTENGAFVDLAPRLGVQIGIRPPQYLVPSSSPVSSLIRSRYSFHVRFSG